MENRAIQLKSQWLPNRKRSTGTGIYFCIYVFWIYQIQKGYIFLFSVHLTAYLASENGEWSSLKFSFCPCPDLTCTAICNHSTSNWNNICWFSCFDTTYSYIGYSILQPFILRLLYLQEHSAWSQSMEFVCTGFLKPPVIQDHIFKVLWCSYNHKRHCKYLIFQALLVNMTFIFCHLVLYIRMTCSISYSVVLALIYILGLVTLFMKSSWRRECL